MRAAIFALALLVLASGCGGAKLKPPLTITTVSLTTGIEGANYTARLEASGGVPPYHWAIQGDLPAGLALDPDTGMISGDVGYRLTDGEHPKDFTFWVVVTDSSGTASTRKMKLLWAFAT